MLWTVDLQGSKSKTMRPLGFHKFSLWFGLSAPCVVPKLCGLYQQRTMYLHSGLKSRQYKWFGGLDTGTYQSPLVATAKGQGTSSAVARRALDVAL